MVHREVRLEGSWACWGPGASKTTMRTDPAATGGCLDLWEWRDPQLHLPNWMWGWAPESASSSRLSCSEILGFIFPSIYPCSDNFCYYPVCTISSELLTLTISPVRMVFSDTNISEREQDTLYKPSASHLILQFPVFTMSCGCASSFLKDKIQPPKYNIDFFKIWPPITSCLPSPGLAPKFPLSLLTYLQLHDDTQLPAHFCLSIVLYVLSFPRRHCLSHLSRKLIFFPMASPLEKYNCFPALQPELNASSLCCYKTPTNTLWRGTFQC